MIRFAENLNKMITAGLGGAMEAPSTEVAVGHCIRYLEASGPVASFESNIAAPIRNLRVDMHTIQAGSGDPSPDNIRPITGRESVTAWRTGKNLFDQDANYASLKQADGSFRGVMNPSITTIHTNIPSAMVGQQVTFSAMMKVPSGSTIGNLRVAVNIGGVVWNGTLVNSSDYSLSYITFTPSSTDDYVYFSFGSDGGQQAQFKDVMLALGTDATYEPYDGQSATVQLGQTVYGGTVDVITGTMTVEWENIASYDGEALPGEWISDRDAYAPGTTPTTGAQVVYVLDTPQTIDLDPQQIMTLKGTNNVWSNSGDVTLEYPYYEETEGY